MKLKTWGLYGAIGLMTFCVLTILANITCWLWVRALSGILAAYLFVSGTCALIDMIREIKKDRHPPMTLGEWIDK